jgi:hypothetical protein
VALLGMMGTGYAFQFYTIDEPPMTDDGKIDLSRAEDPWRREL